MSFYDCACVLALCLMFRPELGRLLDRLASAGFRTPGGAGASIALGWPTPPGLPRPDRA